MSVARLQAEGRVRIWRCLHKLELTMEWAVGGVVVLPAAMAACSLACLINTRVIARRRSFEGSGDSGRVHDEDVFSLRVVDFSCLDIG
jgi:hypothetical protein